MGFQKLILLFYQGEIHMIDVRPFNLVFIAELIINGRKKNGV
jgi:hypothetical protein